MKKASKFSENHAALVEACANNMGVAELEPHGLSTRAICILERCGIMTVKELLHQTPAQLQEKKQIGPAVVREIKRAVLRVGSEKLVQVGT
jgi:DNA-directed RNA polymerase alpha subunit